MECENFIEMLSHSTLLLTFLKKLLLIEFCYNVKEEKPLLSERDFKMPLPHTQMVFGILNQF